RPLPMLFLTLLRPPTSTPFPYTTLFRSEARERIAQLGVARLRVLLQHRRGGHHPAVDAIAALGHALGNIRRLQRMRLLRRAEARDRKSTRLNSSHRTISYAVFCLKKKKT